MSLMTEVLVALIGSAGLVSAAVVTTLIPTLRRLNRIETATGEANGRGNLTQMMETALRRQEVMMTRLDSHDSRLTRIEGAYFERREGA